MIIPGAYGERRGCVVIILAFGFSKERSLKSGVKREYPIAYGYLELVRNTAT